MKKNASLLIIRFSSFGDIVQLLGSVNNLKAILGDNGRICILTKKEFSEIAQMHPLVDEVIPFDKKNGFISLLRLYLSLRNRKFDYVYDAHNNLRSFFSFFFLRRFSSHFLTRSKDRVKRFFWFYLKKDLFHFPVRGRETYLAPLKSWDVSQEFSLFRPKWFSVDETSLLPYKNSIVFVPSAAWPMKRWPLSYWKELAEKIAKNRNEQIVVLGGPQDEFCGEIKDVAPEKIVNMAGKLTLLDSSWVVSNAALVISGDTGLMHVADVSGVPLIALIGPSAFGHPSSKSSTVLEVERSEYPCKPCSKDGRGRCVQPIYQECLVKISSETVYTKVNELLSASIS